MRLAGRISVTLLVLSALFWMTMRDVSPGMDVTGSLLTIIFGVLTVLIRLRNEFRDAGSEAIGSRYLAGVIVTCLVAGSLLAWSIWFALEDKPEPVINAGVVTAWLTGPVSGDSEYIGSWTAGREVSLEAYSDASVTATLSVTEDSSRPELDLVIPLADGTNVLCDSDEPHNWISTGSGIALDAYCNDPVPWSELRNLQSIHLSESHGAGVMYNSRTNPSYKG